jgi:pyruvate kinase
MNKRVYWVCFALMLSIGSVASAEPKTFILATLGPASSSVDTMQRMVEAGLDQVRINFSHGSHESNFKLVQTVWEVEKRTGKHIPILVDLQGPRYRIGKFKDNQIELKQGQSFRLDLREEPGDETRVQFNHKPLYKLLAKDGVLLLKDGSIKLRVTAVSDQAIDTVVERAGSLGNNKGVNLPTMRTDSLDVITPKDRADVSFAVENIKPDYFALSFVNNAQNIKDLRALIGNSKSKIIAKIETPQAMDRLDEITRVADGLMVARGDLAVEFGYEKVPVAQRQMIEAAKRHKKFVIVATEMMASMENSPLPTRAEASDVATAVFLGADGTMLSGESATGKYPIETVEAMNKILEYTELNKGKRKA